MGASSPPVWSAGISFEEAERTARVTRRAYAAITQTLLDGAALCDGLRVLDLACGQGVPALDVARRVGPVGTVVGLDLSRPSVALARRFASAEHRANVSFLEGDAESLPFGPSEFDRVTSRFGPMFFPDLDRGVAEARRVLRPAGRIAWLVWGPIEEQLYFTGTALVAMRHAGLDQLPPEAGRPFRFGAGSAVATAFRTAGLRGVAERKHRVSQEWPVSAERLARGFWSAPAPPFRALVDRLTPSQQAAGLAESIEAFRRFSSDGEVRLEASVWLITGKAPPAS